MSTEPVEFEQLRLFGPSIDLSRLRAAEGVLMLSTKSRNTVLAYASSWRSFSRWCLEAGRQALPASADTVRLFVLWCIDERGYRLDTVRTHLSAIRAEHVDRGQPSPVDDRARKLVSNAARVKKERSQAKRAVTPEQLERISLALPVSAAGVRDRAIVVLGFALGWRRSELAGLCLADLRFVSRRIAGRMSPGVRVVLGASKSDQDGSEGREVWVPAGRRVATCPVRALRAWLEVRGSEPGPVFCRVLRNGRVFVEGGPLSGETIAAVLKSGLELIGEDAGEFGAHSLRAGCVTAAAENGADVIAIMQRTGHRSMETVLKYVRPAQAFRADPLRGVL